MTQANEAPLAILKDNTGHPLSLQGVSVHASLSETLASIQVEQRYRNPHPHNIEAVYTFPLPLGAVLLDLEVDIAGQKLVGQVIEKKTAEQRYEAAITDGNSAVMVQMLGNGLYSMNVGNLLAGETAVIRFRYALTLSWLGEQLRLSIPTSIAPRYGDAAASGLEPWQIPASSLSAEYPFALTVSIAGKLADAEITCPTHQVAIARTALGLAVTLNPSATLDRDFVLTAKARAALESSCLVIGDHEERVALATLRIPPLFDSTCMPLCLKMVIDCSGSMAGVSIAQARKAALAMLDLLKPEDSFNVTLFGDHHEHLFDRMVVADSQNIEYARLCLTRLEANLGGTETAKALAATYKLTATKSPDLLERAMGKKHPEQQHQPSVLLITDGEIWNTEEVIAQAISSKHRVFTVGVGMSVAEGFVTAVANSTGAACELVSPQEGMADKILAQFHRLQQPKFGQAEVVWDVAPVWQTAVPAVFFAGDTLHVYAGFTSDAPGSVRLQMTTGAGIKSEVTATAAAVDQPDVARLAAHARIALSTNQDEQTQLALRYQLLTERTHFLVVAERQDKPDNLPILDQVPQMQPAGWGGIGVAGQRVPPVATGPDPLADVPVMFCRKRPRSSPVASALHGEKRFDIPAFLRRLNDAVPDAEEQEPKTTGKATAAPSPTSRPTTAPAPTPMPAPTSLAPNEFIASLNRSLAGQVSLEALPSTPDQLLHLGLPDDIVDALTLQGLAAGTPQSAVAAFLHALAEGPCASLFEREVNRLVLAQWKRQANDPLLDQWCVQSLAHIEQTAWNWTPQAIRCRLPRERAV